MAPLFTASTMRSASAKTWAWAKPPTISPVSSSAGGGQVLACSMMREKSLVSPMPPGMWGQPGYPAAPVVGSRGVLVCVGGALEVGGLRLGAGGGGYLLLLLGWMMVLVVMRIGPWKASNSSFCFHQALP